MMRARQTDSENPITRAYPAAGRAHDCRNDAACWCVPLREVVAGGILWVHHEAGAAEPIARGA